MRPGPPLRPEEAPGGGVPLRQAGEVWPVTHTQPYPQTQRKAGPAPWVLKGPQPRPQPPPAPGLPPTGRTPRPPPGLALASQSMAFQSCPHLQPQPPGPSRLHLPTGGLGQLPPGPSGSSRSSGLAGPLGSRWAPPATTSPARWVLRPPQLRCCPLYPALGPPGRGASGAGRPACALHPWTRAFSRPGPLGSVCLGPSMVTAGDSHLAAVTPSPGRGGPSPAPRPGQPAVGSVAAAEVGPHLPPPPGLWGLLRATAPLGQSQPACPLGVGVCGWKGSTEGSPQPAPQCPRPMGSPALAPGLQAHPPLPSLGRPPEPSLGGWRGETQDGGTCPLSESHGGQ